MIKKNQAAVALGRLGGLATFKNNGLAHYRRMVSKTNAIKREKRLILAKKQLESLETGAVDNSPLTH